MHGRLRRWLSACAFAFALATRGSESGAPAAAPRAKHTADLGRLAAHERALRTAFDPARAPSSWDNRGPDPYRIVSLPGGGYAGALRGDRALVRLDSALHEVERLELPESPTALTADPHGVVYAASRSSDAIWAVDTAGGPLRQLRVLRSGGEIADLAVHGNVLVVLGSSHLSTLDPRTGAVRSRSESGLGGERVLVRAPFVVASSRLEHSVRVWRLEGGSLGPELGRASMEGPFWGLDAAVEGDTLFVAATGVEDQPLVRTRGEFENIDSFLYLYRLSSAGALERLAATNLSDLGVVVPKVVTLAVGRSELEVTAVASGSSVAVTLTFARDSWVEPPRIHAAEVPPGSVDGARAGARLVLANPLLDAWLELDAGLERARTLPGGGGPLPSVESRLGEALFFTTLIAPKNSSEGSHSRFTCETCHFEAGVDGRVHHTGRGNVRVATRPLYGLGNNRPHFSRALDPDLARVSHNEFRVAGAGSGSDPWFTVTVAEHPWLRELGVNQPSLSALDLREALVTFLYELTPPPARSRAELHFTAEEAQGAASFAERCERCHEARLVSDDPASRLPPERWAAFLFSRNAPIVWARGDYERVGVEPYVGPHGTRIPPLRRIAHKWPYFTNGSARSLAEVLARFREGASGSRHEPSGAPGERALNASERASLEAFLTLL